MSIQTYLDKIRNAIYGKDVRQALHDGLEECYRTASVDHDNANMEVVRSRGKFETLNKRLEDADLNNSTLSNEVTSLKATKVNKNELPLSGFKFKGNMHYNDLPTTANEIGDKYYVTDRYSFYAWDGDDWALVGAIGDGIYAREQKVTTLALKQDYVAKEIGATSISLDSYELDKKQGVVDCTTGDVMDASTLFYIELSVDGYKSINHQVLITTGNAGIAFYNANNAYVGGVKYTNSTGLITGTRSETEIPSDAKYMKLCYLTDEQADKEGFERFNCIQLSADSIMTSLRENVDTLVDVNILQEIETITFSDFLGVEDGIVSASTGEIVSTRNSNFYVDIPSKSYIELDCQVYKTGADAGIAFLDADKNYISGFKNMGEVNRFNIKIPSTATYIRYCYLNDDYALEEGYPVFDYILLIGKNSIAELTQKVNLLENIAINKTSTALTYHDLSDVMYGVVSASTGEIVSTGNSNFYTDIYIPSKSYIELDCQVYKTGADAGIAFLDADKNYISGFKNMGEVNRFNIKIPSTATYIRYCYLNDDYALEEGYPVFDYILLIKSPETLVGGTKLIDNYDIISQPLTEVMSHGSELLVDDVNGNMYNAYLANPVSVIETPADVEIVPKLSVFNLCNPIEKEIYEFARANTNINGVLVGNRPPYEPNIALKENIIYYYMNLLVDGKLGYYVRTFNTRTKIVNDDLQICKIIDNGKEYDFTLNNVVTIYNNLTSLNVGVSDFMLTCKIINDESGNYYSFITGYGTNFGGMILKTIDLNKWEVVHAVNQSLTISEAQMAIVGSVMYLTVRDNSKGIFKLKYDLVSDELTNYGKCQNSIASRPATFKLNNSVYIMYNVGGTIDSGYGPIARNRAVVTLIDEEMNEDIIGYWCSLNGFHYYSIESYKDELYMAFSSDKRKLSASQSRSNIGFTKLVL